MPWNATFSPARVAVAASSRNSAASKFGAPHGCAASGTVPAYGSQHQAVAVLSDPSVIAFAGPIVTSPPPPSTSPVRTPLATTSANWCG